MKALKATGLAFGLAVLTTAAGAQTKGDWAHFGGDIGDTKYSALDQINAKNIKRLKIAWRAPAVDPALLTENPGLVLSNNFRDAPLVADGVMYISDQDGQVEARDPGNGKVLWRQPGFEGDGPAKAVYSSRAIALWGTGDAARVVTARGSYLYLLDAKTGAYIKDFGDNGRVDGR